MHGVVHEAMRCLSESDHVPRQLYLSDSDRQRMLHAARANMTATWATIVVLKGVRPKDFNEYVAEHLLWYGVGLVWLCMRVSLQ